MLITRVMSFGLWNDAIACRYYFYVTVKNSES